MPEVDELPDFQRQQFAFTGHLRDPDGRPVPAGVEARRMAVYRELIYNNIEGFLASAFPVLRSLDSDALWHHRVREFLKHHRAKSPYFSDIPREFLQFLQTSYIVQKEDPPFLLELAHYEWVELALSIQEADLPEPTEIPAEYITEMPLALSPLAWPLAYTWPVHRISADYRPETLPESPTRLVVWRDRADEVRFLAVNAASARLITLIDALPAGRPTREAVERLAQETGHPDVESLLAAAGAQLQDWLRCDILVVQNAPRAAGSP